MATKNSNKKTATPSAGRQLLAKPLLWFIAVCWLILLATAAVTNLVFLKDANTVQLTIAANQHAEDYANTVSTYIDGHNNDLARLITQPRVIAALESKDPVAINAIEQEFVTAFADASSLKILPISDLGTADPLLSQRNLSTIETNMVQRSISGEKVLAEGYKSNGNHVGLIANYVNEQGQIRGVILLELKVRGLYKLLVNIAGSQGEVTLAQSLHANNKFILGQMGTAADDAQSFIKPVRLGDGWQLEFRPSDSLIENTAIDSTLTWTIFAFAAVLTALAGYITFRIASIKLDRNITHINTIITGWAHGKQIKPEALTITGLNSILLTARKLVRQRKQSSGQKAAPADKPKTKPKKRKETLPPVPPPVIPPEELDGLPDELKMDLFDFEEPTTTPVPASIFRAYDIRGLAHEELSKNAAYQIGLALGSEAKSIDPSDVIVGRDGRVSSPQISDNLIRGVIDSGCNVINLGAVPTPLMYFATHKLHTANGAIVTGSHLTAEYNGIKMVLDNRALLDDDIQELRRRIDTNSMNHGLGDHTELDIIEHYIADVVEDISVGKSLKVVIDCANAIPAIVAPELLTALDCEVIPLFCELDGNFPNHAPNPSKKANLKTLADTVKLHNADLGIAFDGDGDRMAAMTNNGTLVHPDHLAALFAADILADNKDAVIVYDVKCGKHLKDTIEENSGDAVISASGHSRIKATMAEEDAIFGAEYTGHFFFADRWPGFDDGLYAAARLIELISNTDKSLSELTASIPVTSSPEEILVPVTEGDQFAIVEAIKENDLWPNELVSTIDGIRVDFDNGWGLIRGSNTSANLSLRFEAENSKALSDIQSQFRKAIKTVRPEMKLRF